MGIAAVVAALAAGIGCGVAYIRLLDTYYITAPDIADAQVYLTALYSVTFFGISASLAILVLLSVIQLRQ